MTMISGRRMAKIVPTKFFVYDADLGQVKKSSLIGIGATRKCTHDGDPNDFGKNINSTFIKKNYLDATAVFVY